MIAKAQARYIRITPRKFRQIIPLVKGKGADEAMAILTNLNKRASVYAIELLKSAIANAKRLHQGIDTSTLYISNLIANCGPQLKRYRAASMGRASPIIKRTSHLLIELDAHQPAPEAAPVTAAAGKAEKGVAAPKRAAQKPSKEAAQAPKTKAPEAKEKGHKKEKAKQAKGHHGA